MSSQPTIYLNSEQSDRMWRWVLQKQGIGGHRSFYDALEISEASMGLHAARNPSPYATVAARIDRDLPASTIHEALQAEQLVTVRCMRRTLHALPARLASVCHAATLRYRMQNLRALGARAGIAWSRIEQIGGEVAELLTSHPHLGHRAIEAELGRSGVTTDAARLGLKHAWESGHVVYRNRSQSWHREHRTFSHASRVPAFIHLDEAKAVEQLVIEYFSRYGPATLRDASWWSGLAQRTIASVLDRHDAITLNTVWSAKPCYMFQEQYADAQSWDHSGPSRVAFLAHEDVALKAYFETRDRYLRGLLQRRVFNQIGEVLPTVVRDGIVVGLWQWDADTRRVRYRQFAGLGTVDDRLVRSEAARTTQLLRAGYNVN